MPHKKQIAQYWVERGVIGGLEIDHPGCFACHSEHGSTWENSRLDKAHLVPSRSGGPADVTNLVLLCARCHREAPMIGASKKPMLDWINNREPFICYQLARLQEELRPIDQVKLKKFAESIPDNAALLRKFIAGAVAMDFHPHPGGDSTSSAVAILKHFISNEYAEQSELF